MNMTCDRLRGLRPGHVLIYYRGALEADIQRSHDAYACLLRKVRETAQDLQRAGRLTLSERKAVVELEVALRNGDKVTHRVPILEYMAVGR